jgi:anti-sigma factor RsiW
MADTQKLTDEERQELIAYLDGELDEETARTVEARLQRDPRARQEAEDLKKTWEMLDYLPQSRASGTFTTRTLTQLQFRRQKARKAQKLLRWVGMAGWAAGLLVVGLLSFWLSYRPKTPPAVAEPPPEADRPMLERRPYWDMYNKVGDVKYLRELEDIFGGDES